MAKNNPDALMFLVPEYMKDRQILEASISEDLFHILKHEIFDEDSVCDEYFLKSALLLDDTFWENILWLVVDKRNWLKKFIFKDGRFIMRLDLTFLYDPELVSLAMITYPQIYYIVPEEMRKIIEPIYDLSCKYYFPQLCICLN